MQRAERRVQSGRAGVVCTAWVVLAVAVGGARAQGERGEDVKALSAELARVQAVVRDEEAGESARVAAARDAHELRARLIELAPGSLEAPTWLADQAADALGRAVSGHDDLSVLFGVPTAAEVERVRAAATEAAGLVARAQASGEALVKRLEADLFKEDVAPERVAAIEQAMSRLIDEELEARVPLLSARAAALLAATAPQGEEGTAAARASAKEVLERLAELRYRTVEAEAERLTLTGSALVAAAGEDLQMRSRAREMFRAAAARLGMGGLKHGRDARATGEDHGSESRATDAPGEDHGSESRATAVLRAYVRLGLLRTGGADPARLVVEREAAAAQGRALVEAWAGSELADAVREAVCAEMLSRDSKDAAWVGRALGLLVEGVDFGGDAGKVREMGAKVGAALRRAGGPGTAGELRVDLLPRKAALAAAIALEGGDDVATLGERLRLLRAAAREPEIAPGAGEGEGADDAAVRAEALWRLAAVLAESERTAELIEGAEALAGVIRLGAAGRGGGGSSGEGAFEAAVEAGPKLAHFALARAVAGGDAKQVESAKRVLARVLFAVVQRAESGRLLSREARDAARLELAGLLVAEASGERELDASGRASVLDEMVWVLEGLEPGGGEEIEAEAARLMIRGMLLARGVGVEARSALAERATAWADARGMAQGAWLRLEYARALLQARDARALEVVRPLADLEWAQGGRAGVNVAEVRLTLAQAQRAAGDAAGAFATLKALTTALDQPVEAEAGATTGARPAIFWEAWAEMLEMLAAANEDGARTADIRLQLKRLALIDEGYGGGAAGERIRAAGDALPAN